MNTPKISEIKENVLSNRYYKFSDFEFNYDNGEVQETQRREVFDRGNGAAVLLYNRNKNTVILIEQFRLPTYLNGNETGMLIEACAGTMDEDNPEMTVIREAQEETGYHIDQVEKAFETYMSPGAVTEILYLYIASYSDDMKKSKGGGLDSEHEHIDTLEVDFQTALSWVKSGKIKDAKTILLLQFLQLKGIMKA